MYYTSCCEVTNFNYAVTLALLFSSQHVSQLCSCDFNILCLCSNILKDRHFCFAAWPKRPMVVWITCMMTMQHFFNVANSLRHLCRGSYPLITESLYYSNNFSTLDSISHAIACEDFTRSRNLVIGYFADITAGQRNWCFTEIGPRRQNPL